MHFAYFSSVSWSCCCCSGENCGRAAAKYFWQAWKAVRTFGSLRSNVCWPFPPPGRTLPLESTVGSGKSFTPFARMHCAAFSSAASRSACEAAGVAASFAVDVVLSAIEATPGAAEELPPHAARAREATTANAAGPRTRNRLMRQVNQPHLRGRCETLGARRARYAGAASRNSMVSRSSSSVAVSSAAAPSRWTRSAAWRSPVEAARERGRLEQRVVVPLDRELRAERLDPRHQRHHRGRRQVGLLRVEALVEAVAEHDQLVLDDVEHGRVGGVIAADVLDRDVDAAQVELQAVVEHDLWQHDLEPGAVGDLDPDHVAAERDLLAGLDPRVERLVAPVERRLARELRGCLAVGDDRHVERRAAEGVVPVPVRSAPRRAAAAARAAPARAGTTRCGRRTRPPRAARWRCGRRRRPAPAGRCARRA